MAIYEITIPPSTNNLFTQVRGRRIKSSHYRTWIEENSMWLKLQRIMPVEPPAWLAITINGGEGFNRGRDLDNLLKATSDLLVSVGILPGDNVNNLVDVRAIYRDGKGKATCTVAVGTESRSVLA